MKTLLIVESPAKSKTIEKLLGDGYIVLSSYGHIRNLDKKSLGIDVNNDFEPNYRILTDRSKQIKAIQDTIKKVDNVLLASDEDREGEAIAWHCAIVFKLDVNSKNRICFHEITKSALEHAVANPRKINMSMVYSQQARRILDRLVGFNLSPLLWKYIAPKLSAGRVQSVALKVIVDQEKEIEKFTEKKYFKTVGNFDKKIVGTLNNNFLKNEDVSDFLEQCKSALFVVKSVEKSRLEKRPPPPYITSTIQQDACNRFGVGAKKIMSSLQKLYEHGLITYHRTDSTNLSTSAQDDIKKIILEKFGKNYCHPRIYKSKIKCAQEAHEAIRPTHFEKAELDDSFEPIEKKIYNIIWKRTVSSQMSAYVYDNYTIKIGTNINEYLFISKIEQKIFDGYKIVYDDTFKGDDDAKEDDIIIVNNDSLLLDDIKEGESINYTKITSTEKYDNNLSRYTEASLIKKMEKVGIGRPSTYSNIIETIMERKYVEKKDLKGKKVNVISFILDGKSVKEREESITIGAEKKKLVPTDVGINTTQFLVVNFTEVLNSNFTSDLENRLDDIANSASEWNDVVGDFYEKFKPGVDKLNSKELISKSKDERKRVIGKNVDGEPLYAYIAKYGPVIQIGDGKDCKYVKIDPKYSVNTITYDDYLEMTKFPKKLGIYNDSDVFVKNGPYGYYLSYNEKNYKLLEGYDENLLLEDGIKCINNNSSSENGEGSGKSTLIKVIDNYSIKNGPYGYYIHYNKKFFNIPKEYDIEKLTKKECDTIIKIPKKAYKKK